MFFQPKNWYNGHREVRSVIKSVKIRLKPTVKQEELMKKSAGTARYAYNWG